MFDLDNTLYPHHLNLWQQVDDRIRVVHLGFPQGDAGRGVPVQKDYYKRYGTTMRGLMTEHGITPDDYLEFVHEIDHSPLSPTRRSATRIEELPGRKLILTNGTREACRRGDEAARDRPAFRGRVRHRRRRARAQAAAAGL